MGHRSHRLLVRLQIAQEAGRRAREVIAAVPRTPQLGHARVLDCHQERHPIWLVALRTQPRQQVTRVRTATNALEQLLELHCAQMATQRDLHHQRSDRQR